MFEKVIQKCDFKSAVQWFSHKLFSNWEVSKARVPEHVLFALYMEPMLMSLNKNIKGVLVDDVFIRAIAYADDLNIFIRDDEEFSVALELINYYSIYSKIKINFH